MKTAYNNKKLIKIRVFDACKSDYYKYQKELKLFGFTIRKERIVGIWESFPVSKLPENYFLKDDIVYEKPELLLNYEGDVLRRIIFETVELAQEKAKTYINGNFEII